MKKTSSKLSAFMPVLIWLVLIVIVWEAGAFYLKEVSHDKMYLQKLPYLHSVFANIGSNFGSLLKAGLITTSRALYGLCLGSIVGFIVAVILSFSNILEKMIFPHLIVFQMIPILALAPIVYSIVKDQDSARVILSAFITFFPVTINVHSGLKGIEKEKKELLYSYGALPIKVFNKLLLPSSLPHLFTGLKLAAPSAITAGILVEMLGADNGIGIKIISGIYYGKTGALAFWGAVLVAALLGMMSYYIIVILEKYATPWANRKQQ